MKIKIGNKKYELDLKLDGDQKVDIINNIFNETILYRGNEIRIEDFLNTTYHSSAETRKTCDVIGYYLTKDSAKDGILSRNSMQEMVNGSTQMSNFSSLGAGQETKLGIASDNN